ncbi:MAG: PHB depolymerase family esterase [Desulfobacterales bacterium]
MMDAPMAAGMHEATHLTRAGQLHEAVAIIQRTLQGVLGSNPAADAPSAAAETTIEGRCRVIDDEMGTYANEPQRRYSLGPAASPGHTETIPEPTAASLERTATPPPFGAGRHERWREQWREYRGPTPWPEPIPDRAPDIVPDGARFTSSSYTNHAGTRSYKLYIPSGYHGQPLPLVVMLHGCTQNPDDFAAGTRMNVLAEEHQCFVAYPAQSPAANGLKCWNWFEAADQQRDRGEPSIIAGLTRQILDSHRVDTRRIYVAGLSAGGAMAVTLAMTYPDLYAAIGIHSGLPHAVAQDLPSALTAMHSGKGASARWHTAGAPVPAIVFHGDRDTTVHPCNSDQVITQCAPSHARRGAPPEGGPAPRVSVERGQVPHGHAYTHTTYHDASGQTVVEHWLVHGAGHAWSGGSSRGSYTDPKGPDASQEMLRFFYDHPQDEVSASVS